jgi:PadR family transcriptional regulator PadR
MVTQDWTSQMRRGALELCVLRVVQAEPSYGYAIVEKLAALGPLAAGENNVYPLLRRLRGEGALEAYAVESAAGPPRQYLRITPEGAARLNALRQDWLDLANAVERCLASGDAP